MISYSPLNNHVDALPLPVGGQQGPVLQEEDGRVLPRHPVADHRADGGGAHTLELGQNKVRLG